MLGRQTNVYVSRHNMYKAYCTMFTQPTDKLDFHVCHSQIADHSARVKLERLKAVLKRLNNDMINFKGRKTDRSVYI